MHVRVSMWLAVVSLSLALSRPALAQECQSDDDCPSGFGCDLAPSVAGDCRDGEPCDAGTAEPASGQCEPQALVCEADADCPEGLVCGEPSRGDVACAAPPPGVDAGPDPCGETEPEPATRECTFDPPPCDTDADCTQAGFICLHTEGASTVSCSGSAGDCAGGDCPPPEETCEETPGEPISYCFPERQDCSDDGDCSGDWRCVELPQDAQDHPPPGWEGVTQVCLPEGLALALEGSIELGRGGVGSSSAAADSAGGSDLAAQGESASAADEGSASSGDDDGGCGVARPGSAHARGASFALTALALLARRRRRRGA